MLDRARLPAGSGSGGQQRACVPETLSDCKDIRNVSLSAARRGRDVFPSQEPVPSSPCPHHGLSPARDPLPQPERPAQVVPLGLALFLRQGRIIKRKKKKKRVRSGSVHFCVHCKSCTPLAAAAAAPQGRESQLPAELLRGLGAVSGQQPFPTGDLGGHGLHTAGAAPSKGPEARGHGPLPMQEAEPPARSTPRPARGVNLGPQSRLGKLAQCFPQAN